MKYISGRSLVIAVLLLTFSAGANSVHAATGTRTSTFTYDPASGLLLTQATTAAGADIASRTDSNTYDARGQFVVTKTNALGQQETWQYDARFGSPTSHTGPNGLTTTSQYD